MKQKKHQRARAEEELQNNWNTVAGKRNIVWAIFKSLRGGTAQQNSDFLDSTKTRKMAETLGQTTIPDGLTVYCFPEGDMDHGPDGVGASLILEIPPITVPLDSEKILEYSCSYTLWRESRAASHIPRVERLLKAKSRSNSARGRARKPASKTHK